MKSVVCAVLRLALAVPWASLSFTVTSPLAASPALHRRSRHNVRFLLPLETTPPRPAPWCLQPRSRITCGLRCPGKNAKQTATRRFFTRHDDRRRDHQRTRREGVSEAFDAIEGAVASGGPAAAYCLVAAFDSIPLLPTQPITIATGAAFGLGPGLCIVVCGQATAATACFLVGRLLLGPETLERFFGDKVAKVAQTFVAAGGGDKARDDVQSADSSFLDAFKAVVLLRQSPVVPFSVGNYVLGAATDAPVPALVLGTVVGCLPLNALYTATGAVVRGGAKAFLDNLGVDIAEAEEALGLVGALATVALLYLLVDAYRKVAAAE